MKTHLSGTAKFGLFFAVAFLALLATPAAPADSAGSGTFVATGKNSASVTFNDVYAFRAEDSYDKTKQVTVVLLTDSPLDKKAMTAALRKERSWGAVEGSYNYLKKMAYAKLDIDQNGKIKDFYLYNRGTNYSLDGGKSDVKVNTAKRVEGSFSYDKPMFGEERKIDLRFATDLADIGPPVKN